LATAIKKHNFKYCLLLASVGKITEVQETAMIHSPVPSANLESKLCTDSSRL